MKIDPNGSISRFVGLMFLAEGLMPDPPSLRDGKDEVRRRIDVLSGLGKILGRGSHDVRQILLRVPVIEREPRALYLDLDAVTFQKGVIGGVQAKAILEDFVRGDGLGVRKAVAVTAAKDLCINNKLVASYVSLNFVGSGGCPEGSGSSCR